MAKPYADVYLADTWMWNGLGSSGRPDSSAKPPKPDARKDADLVTPGINFLQPWSDTIGQVVDGLERRQLIAKLFIMGHGGAGEFTMGRLLKWNDDATIAQFRRLRPFTAAWLTHVYIVGCEVAADGPCELAPPFPYVDENGAEKLATGTCLGQFSGNTGKPGYKLLRKLADAINAPVSASPWKQAIKEGWVLRPPRLTVGPGGGWVYRAFNEQGTRFGSP